MKPSHLFVRAFLALSALVLVSTQTLFATEFQYHPQESAIHGNDSAGELVELDSYFNSSTKELTWTATFAPLPSHALNTDGYWLAMNNGPNPKGHSGELALLYFDASDPDNIIVTVYAYNGSNGFTSFRDGIRDDGPNGQPGDQAPDRIISSLTSPDFLQEASLTIDPNNGYRTLHFRIDASPITSHHPFYPDNNDPWFGIGFGELLGFWFHPLGEFNADYCVENDQNPVCLNIAGKQSSVGFLKAISYSDHGFYDTSNRPTNTYPYCVLRFPSTSGPQLSASRPGIEIDERAMTVRQLSYNGSSGGKCYEVAINEPFKFKAKGVDPEGDDLTFTYSGAPGNALIDPVNGTTGPSPLNAAMLWTPSLAQSGQDFNVLFTFTDSPSDPNASTVGAATSCMVPLCVPEDLPPNCVIEALDPDPVCEGEITDLQYTAAGSTDPEQGPLFYSWETTCLNADGQRETIQTINNDVDAILSLTLPGTGVDSNCSIKVTVFDRFEQASECELPVQVPACDLDCFGNPNGGVQPDECGVCGGDGSSCADCLGIPNGNAQVDSCGVCNGDNACVDCVGIPNGDAIEDQCGVCQGDGTSCLGCEGTDNSSVQFEMDGNTLEQLQVVNRSLKMLTKRGTRKHANRKFRKATFQEAKGLQIDGWFLAWSLPNVVVQCSNSEFCVEISNVDTITEYVDASEGLYNLNKKVVRRLRRQLRHDKGKLHAKAGKRPLRHGREQFQRSLELADSVPATASSCSTGSE